MSQSCIVTLNWEKPAKSEIADKVTDDFEGYESFIIEGIGDWSSDVCSSDLNIYINIISDKFFCNVEI